MKKTKIIAPPFKNALEAWRFDWSSLSLEYGSPKWYFSFDNGKFCELNLETDEWMPCSLKTFYDACLSAWDGYQKREAMWNDMAESAESMYRSDMEDQCAKMGVQTPRSWRTEDCSICRGGGCPACCPEDVI